MLVTREQMIKKLSERSGYYQKDIRVLLHSLDEIVLELFGEVADNEDLSILLVNGIRVGCKVVPERERVDPRSGDAIVCAPTVKPFCRFSETFRETIQEQYDAKKDG